MDLDLTIITESWLASGTRLEDELLELELGTGLSVVYKNRPVGPSSRRRTAGGGVAIIYNKQRFKLKERRVIGNSFELVCAKGKINGLDRMLVVIGLYIPPKTTVGQLSELRSIISDLVLQEKAASRDPLFILGGDMNRRDLGQSFGDFNDFFEICHGPTRENEKLDKTFTNFEQQYLETLVCPPLQTATGVKSDHSCIVSQLCTPRLYKAKWEKFSVRKKTEKGNAMFGKLVAEENWDEFYNGLQNDPSRMIDKLHEKLAEWMDKCFPYKQVRRRSNEDPWITNSIRRKIRARLRIFLREGRSGRWKAVNKEIRRLIREEKKKYVGRTVDKCKVTGNNSAYYRVVKELNTKNRPGPWNVIKVFPEGTTDIEAARAVTEYFGAVSDLLPALDLDLVPKFCGGDPMDLLLASEVSTAIKNAKKPNSMVEGDIYPHLYSEVDFGKVITPVYNAVITSRTWPDAWKVETVTVIPKCQNPESLAECRNISCTNFLSKVLESILLKRLREEIPADMDQFGGVKGSSVEHMLVEVWERILSGLEIPDVAVTLLGIDYEKAFNRMGHNECLLQLAKLGASQFSIDLVSSFLTRRVMRSRIGSITSSPRLISAGSPQGSILGCFLYCVTTQQLGSRLIEPGELGGARIRVTEEQASEAVDSESDLGLTNQTSTPVRSLQLRQLSFQDEELQEEEGSPQVGAEDDGQSIQEEDSCLGPNARFLGGRPGRILDSSSEISEISSSDSFRTAHNNSVDIFDFLVDVFKYVDDTTIVEAVDIGDARKHFTTGQSRADSKARYTELVAGKITERADEIGMRVNCKKTQLLMVSPPNGFDNRAFINIQGQRIETANELKLLGFVFGTEPNVSAHVNSIKKKFRARFWSLIHLRRSGFVGDELMKLYNALVRPVIEFCCVIYHPLLTKCQANDIERMQKQVVKLAYGWDYSYQEICAVKSIDTLEERRINYIDNFVRKALNNTRFNSAWFPLRDVDTHNIRDRKIYSETRTRTTRYYNSPLSYMRRRANHINDAEVANLLDI